MSTNAPNVYRELAHEAGLQPWELDRLLYHFNEQFQWHSVDDSPRRRTRAAGIVLGQDIIVADSRVALRLLLA
jgi:hypothetical protein